MSPLPMPTAEIEVSVGLVRRLVAAQQPDLAGRPITVLAHGGRVHREGWLAPRSLRWCRGTNFAD